MSAWLQRQALAPAHVRLVGRALRRRPPPPNLADMPVAPVGRPVTEAAVAHELARVGGELASLRRELRRVGLACLITVFLFGLHYAWPALRWLLLVP